ncbi:hypothetical protein V8G57_11510 [Collimonas sp. H4R21]|uniref:Sigma-70 family RNA polymerase sigma factor n=1 Tax=Collimonas rhizosphaerae TaxID=3126357 RepID=A0ABU9PVH0_9BURK
MATRRKVGVEPMPPKSTDLKGWQEAIAAGHLSGFPLNDLAAAIQDLGADVDARVRNALAKELHDAFYRILRKQVGFNHPNQGLDIIHRTIFKLFKGLSTPGSCDGNAMRKSCYAIIKLRMIDAIVEERRERRTPDDFFMTESPSGAESNESYLDSETGEMVTVTDDKHSDGSGDCESSDGKLTNVNNEGVSGKADYEAPVDFNLLRQQEVEILHFLEAAIPNNLKRMAFRLYMEDVPSKTNDEKTHSIAKAVGKDEKTVRLWVKECIEILKVKVSQT